MTVVTGRREIPQVVTNTTTLTGEENVPHVQDYRKEKPSKAHSQEDNTKSGIDLLVNPATVYLLTCKKCLAQYVGMSTNTMMERHGGHRREIQEEMTPLGRHFARCGIDNLCLQIIAGVRHGEEEALRIAEGHWISRLGTLESQGGGISSMDERKKI